MVKSSVRGRLFEEIKNDCMYLDNIFYILQNKNWFNE